MHATIFCWLAYSQWRIYRGHALGVSSLSLGKTSHLFIQGPENNVMNSKCRPVMKVQPWLLVVVNDGIYWISPNVSLAQEYFLSHIIICHHLMQLCQKWNWPFQKASMFRPRKMKCDYGKAIIPARERILLQLWVALPTLLQVAHCMWSLSKCQTSLVPWE